MTGQATMMLGALEAICSDNTTLASVNRAVHAGTPGTFTLGQPTVDYSPAGFVAFEVT